MDQILPYIQSRMGHRNIMSTMHYVRYIAFSNLDNESDKKFEEILYKFDKVND